MRHKWICAAAAALLVLSLAGCGGIKTTVVPTPEDLPALTVTYGGEETDIPRNEIQWEGDDSAMTTDYPSPLDAAASFTEIACPTGEQNLTLTFSREPEKISVARWSAAEIGNLKAKPERQDLRELLLPSEGSWLYEVEGSWKEGTVTYVFSVSRP
ncbi:MAG: hypothetical protein PHD67_01650 [Oscillospiraceae bacterium]|nr:hypothetical protein [Oscillospiraceae bacterium]